MLQPAAIDLLNPAAAPLVGSDSWLLAVRAGGNAAAIDRYERELAATGATACRSKASARTTSGSAIEEFTPGFLERHPDGAVVRVSCTLKELEAVMASVRGPGRGARRLGRLLRVLRARPRPRPHGWPTRRGRGWKAVDRVRARGRAKRTLDLWPAPGGDLEIMRRIKGLFDPATCLNRGRLYGRI